MASESVNVTNFPDSGSPARVAYDMMRFLSKLLPDGNDKEARIKAYLDLYADCHLAARGSRQTTR